MRLHSGWQTFISLEENKVNLIQILWDQLVLKAQCRPDQQEVVVSGRDEFPAVLSSGNIVDHLNSTHEEADSKTVLHANDPNDQNF